MQFADINAPQSHLAVVPQVTAPPAHSAVVPRVTPSTSDPTSAIDSRAENSRSSLVPSGHDPAKEQTSPIKSSAADTNMVVDEVEVVDVDLLPVSPSPVLQRLTHLADRGLFRNPH